jgi:DNA end-binding protein Ku
MASPRAYWTGHLRLSLVIVPVRLFAASSERTKVRFHKIYKPTGERVHYQNVTKTKGEVDADDIVKGFEYTKGRYVTFEEEELEKVRLESRRTIDLVQFSKVGEIAPMYYDKPYFIAPDGEHAIEAYAVIREALRETGTTAIGQIVLARREHMAAIRPCGKGMLLETLRYSYEVRDSEDYFADLPGGKVDEDQLELAQHLVKQKMRKFDASKFHDHYEEALRELVQAKLKHRKLPELEEPKKTAEVIDLMAALKQSLGEKKKPARGAKKAAAKRKPSARSASRKRKAA